MKNFLIPLFVILLLAFAAKAQTQKNTYSLSDYKNPDYMYQSLGLRLNLSNPFSAFRSDDEGYGNGHAFSLSTDANGNYKRSSNSTKFQGEQNISSGINSFITNSKSNRLTFQTNSRSLAGSYYLNASTVNRYYFKTNKFLEWNPEIKFQMNAGNNINNKEDEVYTSSYDFTKSQSLSFKISSPIYIGIGRIEQVQDAQLAMYIFDDLEKSGLITGSIQNNQIEALAQLITRLKYKRTFDWRIKKIAEMKALDSLIYQTGIVKERGVALFSILRDNWDYASNPIRMNGTRYFVGFKPTYSRANFKTNQETGETENLITFTMENKQVQNDFSLCVSAGVISEKPLSRKWQRSIYTTANGGIRALKSIQSDSFSNDESIRIAKIKPTIGLESGITYGFYPNTRSWFTANWNLLSGYNRLRTNNPDATANNNSFYLYSGPVLNAYYYIAPNLQFTISYSGEFRLDHMYENLTKTTFKELWWNQQINASIVYDLF